MLKDLDKSMCSGCSACVQICPKNCISFKVDREGFWYPEVQKDICVNCGLCKKVCPFLLTTPLRKLVPSAYATRALDDRVREESSSGGIFSLLAEQVIRENGVVYGTAMTPDMKGAHHIRISTVQELILLRGSKYLQSQMKNCFKQVKEDLVCGKKVLFSGVPCQIDGLKLYLNKHYDNLFCVEVICHGVPSPLLWEKYINILEKKYKTKVLSVNFRKKKYGWKRFGLTVIGKNFSQHKSLEKDSYMQMFLKDYCLRPSCYECNAKNIESMADITIADFWGVQNIAPELDDDMGTSLVLIQSDRGRELFEKVKDLTVWQLVNFDNAIKGNPAYYKSAAKPCERDVFFKELESSGYKVVARRYGHLTIKEKMIRILVRTPIFNIYRKIATSKR